MWCFFFSSRRRHTRYWRDWSSDVCSSDLGYRDLIEEISESLRESVELARAAGVADDRIIVDPGIGFGKTREENLEIIRRLPELRHLGFPLLIGPSRKSFIGKTLDLPAGERLEGTAAAVALSLAGGADIVRVHDVKPR